MEQMNTVISYVARVGFTLLGALLAYFEPALDYIQIATLFILADCWTAWRLGKRVAAAYPEAAKPHAHKFLSSNFGRVIITLLKSYVLILLAHQLDVVITGGEPVSMAKIAAGAICFWQLWSILENESSCRTGRFANFCKLLQRVLVDKTSRHLDIDLSSLSTLNSNNSNDNN